ncbi:YcgL domain-containing protein [Cognaticolwellia beringensis]|uniref:YcgL domain-containing protein B5D82_15740 n=1 Tax=Cognaticolwellia beringensis TaxID=1967665 RepID=A0A222GB53_9GAMM|nr:YcgL domain-containing protein [Cognaticolwellia beringensis]ASP49087.1 hypothetical protein B5D82_15740 [Cognaticolwellia beringensis]|tara:strand:+ start:1130 stop:1441 length:312 start_codon:yes stop_codon:yes gene_type:complete
MLCSVYKSSKKLQTYLYVNNRDDFSEVPDALMKMFGKPVMVTVLNLSSKVKLGFADLEKVKVSLADQGYYLQLTPQEEDMLKGHKASMNTAKNATTGKDDQGE